MKLVETKVLGLFPYFGSDVVGGVQASARLAWDAVTEHTAASATLLSYADDHNSNGGPNNSSHGPETLLVNSKPQAIYKAASRNWRHDLVFVWHLGLLRLLPFFRLSQTRVVLMLLGIEAWKEQSWLTNKQLEKVDLFLSISDHTWRKFVEINEQCKTKPQETILLGIEKPQKGANSSPAPKPAALMLSRLSKRENYKGHREVINAWPGVLRQSPDAELWIAGDGDLRSELGPVLPVVIGPVQAQAGLRIA